MADARREADKVLGEARIKADQLERETQERHRSVIGNLDSEREKLERKIDELRSFEREYRARLKSYLEGQLRDLEGRTDGVQPGAPRPAGPLAGGPPPGGPASGPPPGAPPAPPAPAAPAPAPAYAAGAGGPAPVPGAQPPPRPPSPFSPMPAPPVPGAPPQGGPDSASGPSGPPRQASGGGFEVDEGPEVPPSHG